MSGWRRRLAIGLLTALLPFAARAHTTATGLATLRLDGHAATYRLTLILGELSAEVAESLRQAGNGDKDSAADVAALLRSHVALRLGQEACTPGLVRIQASSLGEERVTLELHLDCPERAGELVLEDRWPELLGAHYHTILDVREGAAQQFVLDAQHSSAVVSHLRAARGWFNFIRLGIEHILTGYDHLLFVIALLIGSRTLLQVLGVVTAFTVAHSITLAAAVLGFADIPSAVIEPLIAASIVFMAAENLTTSEQRWRWLVTFGFGLVHGFGFAGVLQRLALGGWELAQALVGFNLGVEIGQAVVILLVTPALWLARRRLKPLWHNKVPSATIALCGTVWLVARLAR